MTKLLEIERKRRFTGAMDEFVARLESRGFCLKSEVREVDSYYSRPDVDFMQTIECLRIRERDGFAEITYKPSTTAATHTTSNIVVKPETNLPIQPSDVPAAKQLLASLGMVQLVVVDKYRRTFRADSDSRVTIAVDEIKDTGVFVETEIISQDKESALRELDAIEKQLGINTFAVETRPYRDICMKR
ncbi:class IV adenylate cyclase [Candidatus Saccharibacteria bacterium]|nr:MAG: class IV adenylate cyclase [Candidatus Saccharibacteria bacterium]